MSIRRLLSALIALALVPLAHAQKAWLGTKVETANLWGVVAGGAGLVAVGTSGTILHSTSGTTWTTRTSGVPDWLLGVAYGSGRYVAVGDRGTILTSTDAITWTPVASPTSNRLNNVQFSSGVFIAVGESGTIVRSEGGSNWVAVTSGTTRWLRGLAATRPSVGVLSQFNPRVTWVATGEAGTALYSYDGTIWVAGDSGTTADLEAVVYESTASTEVNPPYGTEKFPPPPYIVVTRDFVAVGAGGTVRELAHTFETDHPGRQPDKLIGRPADALPPSQARFLSAISAAGSLLVASESGEIFQSPTRTRAWTRVDLGSASLFAGTYFRNRFYFVGAAGRLLSSTDLPHNGQFVNLSTRVQVGTGDSTVIAGFVIRNRNSFDPDAPYGRAAPHRFLIRAVGSSLSLFGISNGVPDPVLEVYNSFGNIAARSEGTNDGFIEIERSIGAFLLRGNAFKDSSSLISSAGASGESLSFTARVFSKTGQPGLVLIEVYDVEPIDPGNARPVNVSTRGNVGTGDAIMIAGFVVQGDSPRTILVRGVGPGLQKLGLSTVLADPQIQVIDSSGTIVLTNDDWQSPAPDGPRVVTAGEIDAARLATGAFALEAGSKDAASLITLEPGPYTILVSGKNGTTGPALVEAYEVPSN